MILSNKRKTRVVHMSSVHASDDVRIFHKQCKTLAAAGYDVTLIARDTGGKTIDGVRIEPVPRSKSRLQRMTRTVFQVLAVGLKQKADIYHVHDPELVPIALLLRMLGKKVIFDAHEDIAADVSDKHYLNAWLRPVLGQFIHIAIWLTSWLLTRVVAATPAIARQFPSQRTTVVQNFPIDDELVTPEPIPFELRSNRITYIGSITRMRGIFEMVEAMSMPEIPNDARLMIAGTFETEALRAEVERLPGWDKVEYSEWISRAEIRKLLSSSIAGVVIFYPGPNYVEALPTKLFEYMSAGIPVIASDFPLWRDIIESSKCGFVVNPHDVSALSEKIRYMLANRRQAEILGTHGSSAVRERYNWTREAKKLLELYQEVAL